VGPEPKQWPTQNATYHEPRINIKASGDWTKQGGLNVNHANPKPLVTLNDLTVGYDEPLVSKINMEIRPGEIISIVGSSGIGKTTLLRTIAGLVKPLEGSINLNVQPRGGLGYIPQKLGLIRHASVAHNVGLGARAGTSFKEDPLTWWKRRNQRVNDAIELMGLSDKADEPTRRLSGGQQKRVATARTLAQQPQLLLADEFLSELDEDNIDVVVRAVINYLEESNAAMILIEHNIERAVEISHRTFSVREGKLTELSDLGGEQE
jgi:ABC-type nitrate/sulfonate/bicarbonate transport system ATPase subunit